MRTNPGPRAGWPEVIRALLVDDEQPARDRLRALLDEFPDVHVVDEARDGSEALELVVRSRPDLVFLDIQMPGLTGLEVAAALPPPRPRIIFCTAFDQYAVDAFEHHATDYLLKPVNKRRLARAIERVRIDLDARRRELREVEEAGRTQARLMPQSLPPMRTLDYAGICRPARGVGGDYYDFLPLGEGRLAIALGDVSGKGLFAGLLVAALQARVQGMATVHGDAPALLVGEANRTMHSSVESNRYATLFYSCYDEATRRLSYVNAGHTPPLLLRGGEVQRLEPNGTVVGLLAEAEYAERAVTLHRGDILLVFSDGVTEALNGIQEEFGEPRLLAAARAAAELPAERLRDAILAELDRFVGGAPPHDDVSLVVAKAV